MLVKKIIVKVLKYFNIGRTKADILSGRRKKSVDSKTKCNILVFKSSRFKEESVNFASWIKEEASSAEEQLDQAIDSCTTMK